MENNSKIIFVLYGLPASGKSTWAKEQLRKYPGKYKRVNKDLLRLMIDNDMFDFNNEKFILNIRDNIVKSSLLSGKNVIIDDTNFPFGGKHFKRMCEIAQEIGNVRVVEKFFDISVKDAILRNKNSDRVSVPDSVIYNMYDKHVSGKQYEFQDLYFEKFSKIPYDYSLPDCFVFDIDGTLSIMSNRSPYDWSKVINDEVDLFISNMNRIIYSYSGYVDASTKIFIITGRDGISYDMTKTWLNNNNIKYDALYMKGVNDNRKDIIVKTEVYENNIKGKYNVIAWIDDRQQVVDKLRSIGLTVLQCNIS